MTFNLIGLGLDKNSISADAIEILKSCEKIYLENYTVNFPYEIEELETSFNELWRFSNISEAEGFAQEGGQEGKSPLKITQLNREKVEDESILKEAKKENIALLVYGDALSATTHMQLILECKKQNIPYKIFHNASIMTAIARTGLQPYKFGKTASMPCWKEHTNKPTSFANYIKENLSCKSHTLILTDIGLNLKDAINQLKETSEIRKAIVLSNAGTKNQKIFYDTLDNLKEIEVQMPFCIIIPTELHFLEKESLEELKEN